MMALDKKNGQDHTFGTKIRRTSGQCDYIETIGVQKGGLGNDPVCSDGTVKLSQAGTSSPGRV